MLCDECKKRSAAVHMTKIIQGKKEETHLCEVCAKSKENISLQNPFTIPNFLTSLLDTNISPQHSFIYGEDNSCQRCGMTFIRFKQEGRLGCEACYEVFEKRLNPLIKKIQGSQLHVGKVPKRTGGVIQLKRQVKQLKLKLQQLIEAEEFEAAAKIRDEVREIEEKIKNV